MQMGVREQQKTKTDIMQMRESSSTDLITRLFVLEGHRVKLMHRGEVCGRL